MFLVTSVTSICWVNLGRCLPVHYWRSVRSSTPLCYMSIAHYAILCNRKAPPINVPEFIFSSQKRTMCYSSKWVCKSSKSVCKSVFYTNWVSLPLDPMPDTTNDQSNQSKHKESIAFIYDKYKFTCICHHVVIKINRDH